MRRVARRAAIGGVLAAGVALWAGPAWAHVSINPSSVAQGSFATFAFQVPNEEEDANTTMVEVEFPSDHPIPEVSVQPIPGWTVDVQTAPLDNPVVSDEGDQITEAVSTVTWSGGAIAPGEFQQFLVAAGPMPDDTDHLEFKAIQTYDNGDVVRWIQETPEGGEEPEFPAPVLELTASTGDEHGGSTEAASDSEDDDSNGLAVVALVVGALGLIAGGAALVMSRRRPTS